jgi:hypothetical protein
MQLLSSVAAPRRKALAAAAALAAAGGIATFGFAGTASADPCASIFDCMTVQVTDELGPPPCLCPWERYGYQDAIREDIGSRFDAVLLNPQPLPPAELGQDVVGGG